MKKRFIRSVSVLLALITVLSCFSAVPFSAAEISDPETGSSGLKIGDVNADGVVNINDCTHLQKYLADLVELDDAQKKVADTNGDGKITILDATKIQKVIARLDDFSIVTDETDEKTFTKGEWVSFIVDKFKMTKATVSAEVGYHYRDIAGSQYADDIETAYAYGILPAASSSAADYDNYHVLAYGDEIIYKLDDMGTAAFEPESVATREFAAVTVYNAMGFQGTLPCDLADEDDITYVACAATMINQGFMAAKNNCFLPDSPVTESDKKTISERIDHYKSREKVDKSEEKCDYEFTDKVVSISSEAVVDELPKEDGGDKKYCVSFSKTKEVLSIEKGSIFSLPVSEANPQGGVFKVLEIGNDESDDMVHFLCKSPELEEAFEYIDIAGTKEADIRDIVLAPGVTLVEANGSDSGAQSSVKSGKSKSSESVGARGHEEFCFEVDASTLSAETNIIDLGAVKLRFTLSNPKFELDARYLYDDFTVEELMIALSKSIDVSGMVIMEDSMQTDGTDIDITSSIKAHELILGTFPIALVEPSVFANVTAFLFVDVYGRVRIGFTLSGKAGIEYSDNQFRFFTDYSFDNPVAEINATAQTGLGLRAVISFFLFDLAGIDIKPGLGITAKAVYHLDTKPTLKCYDFCVYFSLVVGVSEGTLLYETLENLKISLFSYIYTEDYSPLMKTLHCETTGSKQVSISFDCVEECTYTSDVGKLLVDFEKSDGSRLTIDCLRLYDEDGELVRSVFNAGNNLYIDNLTIGRYHIKAFSVEGGFNYYADEYVNVEKNKTVECTIKGAVQREPGKGALTVTCVSHNTHEEIDVKNISLYDCYNNPVKYSNRNSATFDNLPEGQYFVTAVGSKDGLIYEDTSYMLSIKAGEKVYYTFKMKESSEKKKKDDIRRPKFSTKKATFDYDRSMFTDPYYDIIISTTPIDPDGPYYKTDGSWWFFHTYPGENGWYQQGKLNDWRYINDESLSAGTYYLALIIGEKHEENDEAFEVIIPFGVEIASNRVQFSFMVNPDNGQVSYTADTWGPEHNPVEIVV